MGGGGGKSPIPGIGGGGGRAAAEGSGGGGRGGFSSSPDMVCFTALLSTLHPPLTHAAMCCCLYTNMLVIREFGFTLPDRPIF